jgi:hypothetical protein
VEIYNGTNATVNLAGWSLQDASSSDIISNAQLAPGSFLIIAETANVKGLWGMQSSVQVITVGSPIGDGLAGTGDIVRLRNASGTVVDAVSWGTNTSAFNPSAPVVPSGHTLSRTSLLSDSDTASDWRDVSTPSPGF